MFMYKIHEKVDFAQKVTFKEDMLYKLPLLPINLLTSFTLLLSFPTANLLSICFLRWQQQISTEITVCSRAVFYISSAAR